MSEARRVLQNHLKELVALLARMEPEHVGRANIEARIQEAKDGLKEIS